MTKILIHFIKANIDDYFGDVFGAGAKMWHLTINIYCYGQSPYVNDKLGFYSNLGEMKDLAEAHKWN